jgi:hypothetical protein
MLWVVGRWGGVWEGGTVIRVQIPRQGVILEVYWGAREEV